MTLSFINGVGSPGLSGCYRRGYVSLPSSQGRRPSKTATRRNASIRMCSPAPQEPSRKRRERFPSDVRPDVKELLSVLKKCSIYLVGPMGSGKSVVGKYLAFELGFRFLDTDELIEAIAKQTVSEIFEKDGEDNFRDFESAVLDQVQPFIGCCVATGGGAVLRPENWGKLQTGIVVYLAAPVEVLVRRLRGDTKRPLLADAESLEERVSSLLEKRRRLYEQADVTIQIGDGAAVDDVGKDVIRELTNFIKANPPRLSQLYPGNLPKPSK